MTTSGAKSRRDRMIVAAAVVVALYALAALLWFTGRGAAWTRARKAYEKELKTVQRDVPRPSACACPWWGRTRCPPRGGSASSNAWPSSTT